MLTLHPSGYEPHAASSILYWLEGDLSHKQKSHLLEESCCQILFNMIVFSNGLPVSSVTVPDTFPDPNILQ
jgi:hypothetical protein